MPERRRASIASAMRIRYGRGMAEPGGAPESRAMWLLEADILRVEQVRNGLPAGGNGIRTVSPPRARAQRRGRRRDFSPKFACGSTHNAKLPPTVCRKDERVFGLHGPPTSAS